MFYGLVRPCFEALDELLGVVNGYRELLNKLRRRLRSRAKMGRSAIDQDLGSYHISSPGLDH